MTNLDYLIAEPRIVMILSRIDAADFAFLLSASGLSQVKLSSHMSRLGNARYVETISNPDATPPHTYRLTESGRRAAADCTSWLKAIQSARYCRERVLYSWADSVQGSSGGSAAVFANCREEVSHDRS
jgi:DNA-binding MarR family transcriptional regulator